MRSERPDGCRRLVQRTTLTWRSGSIHRLHPVNPRCPMERGLKYLPELERPGVGVSHPRARVVPAGVDCRCQLGAAATVEASPGGRLRFPAWRERIPTPRRRWRRDRHARQPRPGPTRWHRAPRRTEGARASRSAFRRGDAGAIVLRPSPAFQGQKADAAQPERLGDAAREQHVERLAVARLQNVAKHHEPQVAVNRCLTRPVGQGLPQNQPRGAPSPLPRLPPAPTCPYSGIQAANPPLCASSWRTVTALTSAGASG